MTQMRKATDNSMRDVLFFSLFFSKTRTTTACSRVTVDKMFIYRFFFSRENFPRKNITAEGFIQIKKKTILLKLRDGTYILYYTHTHTHDSRTVWRRSD